MSAPTEPIRTVPGARWDCRSCGTCCTLFDLGPVEAHIIEGLVERRIEDHWAPAAEAPWYTEVEGPDGQAAYFLTHRGGHCVFLREDKLCAVHAAFGAEAKPAFCREYPFHIAHDTRGWIAVTRPDCSGAHEAWRDGTPVADQAAAAFALPRSHPPSHFAPERVRVLPGLEVTLERWMGLEDEILDGLTTPRSPEAAIAWLRGFLERELGVTGFAPDPARYRLATLAAIEAHRIALSRSIDTEPATPLGEARAAFAQDVLTIVTTARRVAESGLPALDDEASAYLCDVLRGALLAKSFGAMGGVPEGIGAFLLDAAIARSAAGGDPVTLEGLGAVFPRWRRFAIHPTVRRVAMMARPALIDLFRHAT